MAFKRVAIKWKKVTKCFSPYWSILKQNETGRLWFTRLAQQKLLVTEKEVSCTRNHRMKRYKKDKSLQGIEDLSSMAQGNEMIKLIQN